MQSSCTRWIRVTAVTGVIVGTGLVFSAAPATAGAQSTSDPPVEDPVPGDSPAPGQPVVIDLVVDPAPDSPSPNSEPVAIDGPEAEPLAVEGTADLAPTIEPEPTGPAVQEDITDGAEPDEREQPEAAHTQTGDVDVVAGQAVPESTHAPAVPEIQPLHEVTEHDGGSDSHDDSSHDDSSHGSGSDSHDDSSHGSGSDSHEGGGGSGSPYRMTFAVLWYTSDGEPILELLPEWRTWFELAASSQTGSGKPTSATCAYTDGSDVLTCEFDNRGHSGIDDGMVVPARPAATYTVTVPEDPEAWTNVHANADRYSARDLCPRGGSSDGGHSGGPGGGHDSGHESAVAGLEGGTHDGHDGGSGGGGKAVFCEHVVEMHQVAVVLPPDDPPIEEEGESPTPPEPSLPPPGTESPVGIAMPTVASAASSPRTLPATGSTVSLLLVVGGLLVAAGAALTATTRVRGADVAGAGIIRLPLRAGHALPNDQA